MKTASIAFALLFVLVAGPARGDGAVDVWASYFNYAYVYSSAEQNALAGRLEGYGREAGQSLQDYIVEHFEASRAIDDESDPGAIRRKAIAYLLDYLSRGEPLSLDQSVESIRKLEGRLGRHENRYWYHYIFAHRALEKGYRHDFVGEILDLWLHVVVPLEASYESLQTLSLSDSPSSGFVSALPYIYENVARIILIRSQQMGLDRSLDPLAAIVRLLADKRVGEHPDVIPAAATSEEYLKRIVQRLEGAESDAGSLTFTLALFEATKHHERARGLLASEGLSAKTIEAMRLATGSYETALNRSDTEQGRCAVYTRVLRQIGEVFAAKQRLGVDPEIESSFSIEGAIEVYAELHRALPDGWAELGYGRTGPQSYIEAMHRLWEEIQETILNAGDYYLTRAGADALLADEHSRNAARVYGRYLSFFSKFVTEEGMEGVPDSAYFAAHEAARGIGDAYLAHAQRPTASEIGLATKRYKNALELFPFDRNLWPAFTSALERQGRETEYLDLVRPVAEWVTRSRSVDTWIEKREPGADDIAALRRALSDTQVIIYLGFAYDSDVGALELGISDLRARRDDVVQRFTKLTRQRDASADDATQRSSSNGDLGPLERAEIAREISELSTLRARLEKQIEARERALPVYKATLGSKGLIPALRAQRDHPLHTLLRRMYHENRS